MRERRGITRRLVLGLLAAVLPAGLLRPAAATPPMPRPPELPPAAAPGEPVFEPGVFAEDAFE